MNPGAQARLAQLGRHVVLKENDYACIPCIYENKNQLEIPNVFAGLFTVIVIGLMVENVIFRTIEGKTVRRWGMQS